MTKNENKTIRNSVMDIADKLRQLGYDQATINRFASDVLDIPGIAK
jgi:hypothetical protein